MLVGLFETKKTDQSGLPFAQGYAATREGDLLRVPFFVSETKCKKRVVYAVLIEKNKPRVILKVKNPRLKIGGWNNVELEVLHARKDRT